MTKTYEVTLKDFVFCCVPMYCVIVTLIQNIYTVLCDRKESTDCSVTFPYLPRKFSLFSLVEFFPSSQSLLTFIPTIEPPHVGCGRWWLNGKGMWWLNGIVHQTVKPAVPGSNPASLQPAGTCHSLLGSQQGWHDNCRLAASEGRQRQKNTKIPKE